jgi:hypothetical protein
MDALGYFILFIAFITLALIAIGGVFLWAMGWLAGSIIVEASTSGGRVRGGLGKDVMPYLKRNKAYPLVHNRPIDGRLATDLGQIWTKLGLYLVDVDMTPVQYEEKRPIFLIRDDLVVFIDKTEKIRKVDLNTKLEGVPRPDTIPLYVNMELLQELEKEPIPYRQVYSLGFESPEQIKVDATVGKECIINVYSSGIDVPRAMIASAEGSLFVSCDWNAENTGGYWKKLEEMLMSQLRTSVPEDIPDFISMLLGDTYLKDPVPESEVDPWNEAMKVIRPRDDPIISAAIKFDKMVEVLMTLLYGTEIDETRRYMHFFLCAVKADVVKEINEYSWNRQTDYAARVSGLRTFVVNKLRESVEWCSETFRKNAGKQSRTLGVLYDHFSKTQSPFFSDAYDIAELEDFYKKEKLVTLVDEATVAKIPPTAPKSTHLAQVVDTKKSDDNVSYSRSIDSHSIAHVDIMIHPKSVPVSALAFVENTPILPRPVGVERIIVESAPSTNVSPIHTLPQSADNAPPFDQREAPNTPSAPSFLPEEHKKIEAPSSEINHFTDADFDHVRQGYRLRPKNPPH